MRFGSVCSGIEAASAAWHPLGWRAQFFSEIDRFPCAVLAHHYPHVPNLGDMTKFKEWPDATIDVLVGGTPCQSFSVAGLRKGLADPRGNLMLTYLAIADRYRPLWLVWENVPGVLSDRGNAFGAFLGGLAELGYGFAYRILDAQYFGVPQRRRRVFVVGHLGDWRRAAAVLFERASLRGDPAPGRKAGEDVALPVTTRVDRGGEHREAHGNNLIAGTFGAHSNSGRSYGSRPIADNLIANTLQKHHGNPQLDQTMVPMLAHSLRADGFDASEDGTGRGTPLIAIQERAVCENPDAGPDGAGFRDDGMAYTLEARTVPQAVAFDTTQITSKQNRSNPKSGDPCHPLAAGAHAPAIAFDCKASGQSGFGVGEVASTQRAMGHTGSHQNAGGHQAVMTGMQVRRLTPRECERLQGFEDDYTLITVRGKPAADGPRYKALGNSFAVPVVRWIGERIQAVHEITANLEAVA